MNDVEQIEIQVKEARKRLEEAERLLKERKEEDEWPKCGDMYWSVSSDGVVFGSTWTRDCIDFARLKCHRVYRTEEEARLCLLRDEVYNPAPFPEYGQKYWRAGGNCAISDRWEGFTAQVLGWRVGLDALTKKECEERIAKYGEAWGIV